MTRFFAWFLTWWGMLLLAALDSSMVFFLPFGIDAVVIYLSARNDDLFWLYPLLATAGSVCGAAVTFWIGRNAGEPGLERFMSPRRLDILRGRVRKGGAVALAVPALLPPPFPLTPFILTCGALAVSQWQFFITFGVVRLIRFGAEATLARIYGPGVLTVLQSDIFRTIVLGFIVLAIVGTTMSAWLLWRTTRFERRGPARSKT
jgi:membrane protein YqaA with SNARE-associated domain